MKIHVVEPMSLNVEQKARLQKLGAKFFEGMPDLSELLKRMEGADIVCVDFAPIADAVPKLAKGPKLIAMPLIGVSWLPLKEAAAKGIKFANTPDYATEGVAEFGIALMFTLVKQIHRYVKDEPKPETVPAFFGKTVGIIGAGRIGMHFAKICEGIGMKNLVWERGGDLHKVLSNSDVIYCALSLNEGTKGLLGEKEFAAMKKDSFFVTTSHNQIYDHDALLKALDSNLAGAAMDLEGTKFGDYKSEPYLKFKNHPKMVITPHVAFNSDYAAKRKYDIMIDNIEAFIKGNPTNIVN
jgi:phosphoglycerate dehydrogenase-like enzyme